MLTADKTADLEALSKFGLGIGMLQSGICSRGLGLSVLGPFFFYIIIFACISYFSSNLEEDHLCSVHLYPFYITGSQIQLLT